MHEQYRKTIYFSSKKSLDLVVGAISKISKTERISESMACENILIDYLLPQNTSIKSECEQVWKGEMSIFEALEQIFLYLSECDDVPKNIEELVKYLQKRLMNASVKKDAKYDSDWEYFRLNAYQVYKLLETTYPEEINKEIPIYQSKVKFAKFIIDSSLNLDEFKLINYTNVLLDSWDVVKQSKTMIKSLSTLCEVANCNDNPEDIITFIKIVKQLSSDWSESI